MYVGNDIVWYQKYTMLFLFIVCVHVNSLCIYKQVDLFDYHSLTNNNLSLNHFINQPAYFCL